MNRINRLRIEYRGRVQGVGFRATTRSIASGYNVAGYVRNQPDGSVELVIEGPAHEVDQVLETIQDRLATNIKSVTAENTAPDEPLSGFTIRY